MENTAIPLPQRSRPAALPRPMSKLPAPRSFQQSAIPAPPSSYSEIPSAAVKHKNQPSVSSSSTASSHRSHSSLSSSRPQTGRKTSNESNGIHSPTARNPLYPSQRPPSKQSANTAFSAGFAQDHISHAQLRVARNPSDQENALELLDSPDGSEGSNSNPTSPVHPLKRQIRPSLSDRTVESLAYMSPVSNSRRSSFFNSDSPMASPTKPSSSIPNRSIAKPAQRSTTYPRPASPSKRPDSRSAQIPTPSHRSQPASALPKTSLPSANTPAPASQAKARASARPVSLYGAPMATPSKMPTPGTARTPGSRLSMIAPPKTSFQPSTASARTGTATANGITTGQRRQPLGQAATPQLARPKPRTITPKPVEPTSPLQSTSAEPDPVAESVAKPTSSSASLRAQIAQAKAAHRKATVSPASQITGAEGSSYNFESCDDPFNTGLQNQPSALFKRIESARKDGRLNIAALDLSKIPQEVLTMYDAEAMESSSLTWSEVVDLTRLNAADNNITSISDSVLPDLSAEELLAAEDGRGNQFGGLEHLDLHGNQLKFMPNGLRRLERLTVLNLSRNKLDNSIFETVIQISSLRELRLADNDLSQKVPEEINQLTHLELLDLQNNKLANLPRTIRDLVNLRTLNLSKNRFADLPFGSIFSLPNLLEVYVASNALTGAFFSDNMDTIRSLQTLDISNNSLAALSFTADLHLPALQYINVSSNRIFAFPDVSSWANLLNLLAEENGLTALPAGFTTLKKLKSADFSRNSLRTIETGVAYMSTLESLNVSSNPLRDKRLLNMNTNEIKEDLLKRLEVSNATK